MPVTNRVKTSFLPRAVGLYLVVFEHVLLPPAEGEGVPLVEVLQDPVVHREECPRGGDEEEVQEQQHHQHHETRWCPLT
jgi:hypothetical protein